MAHQATVVPQPRLADLDNIEGWFFQADRIIFDWLLSHQASQGQAGDLAELGVYMGKSAVFLGAYVRDGETLTVCDLFDAPAPDSAVATEMRTYYPTLTRQIFEANYLKFHERLPVIIEGPTSTVSEHLEPHSCRFIHIDASHLYDHVSGDIAAARDLLVSDGIVALDDYRSPHTPGVAAATWEAVINGGLKPIVLTESKLYGTWGDVAEVQQSLLRWLMPQSSIRGQIEDVAGHTLINIYVA